MNVPTDVVEAGLASGRPTYVYDIRELQNRSAALEGIPVRSKAICFATMANDHPAILRAVRDLGHGVFVNSPRHLQLALDIGFAPGRIVYAATNMLPEEMAPIVRHEVRLVLDSIGQICALAEVAAPGQEIGVRLNVGSALARSEIEDNPGYRFGLLSSEVGRALKIANGFGFRIVGAHSYFGTDLVAPRVLIQGLERLANAARELPDLRYLDVGGGFGVGASNSAFDMEAYGHGAAWAMESLERQVGRPVELLLEPGRYLAASAGHFFVRVVDLKFREDRVFVGTNGSVAIFPRPLIYPDRASHPCVVVGRPAAAQVHDLPIYVCGNSTYSGDFLATNIRLPLPQPGDSLMFLNAGAYCRSMITEFLGKDRPDEAVIAGAGASSVPAMVGSSDVG